MYPPDKERIPTVPGRCASCGFLSKRGLDVPFVVDDVVDFERRSGGGFDRLMRSTGSPASMHCYVHAFSLEGEVLKERGRIYVRDTPIQERRTMYDELSEAQIAEADRAVLYRDRHCSKWMQWEEHHSPKEHLEWKKMLALEELRQDLEEKRKSDMQDFHVRLAERDQQFFARLDAANRRMTIIVSLVVGAIAVLQLIVAVVAIVLTQPASAPATP